MTLRRRLTVMSAVTVGVILVAASVICFLVMRSELRGQIDEALRSQARLVRSLPMDAALRRRVPALSRQRGGGAPYIQILSATGEATQPDTEPLPLPVTEADRAVARGQRGQVISDADAPGVHVRVITTPLADGGAIQLARPLESVDSALSRLGVLLAILVFGGVAAAAALSRLFSRQVVAPITALTDAAGHIQATGDLRRRVDGGGDDEVGRMASSFNAMLERVQASQTALESSARAQRQLVADASHELRTPIASLRTNVEVMQVDGALDARDRTALLSDVVQQTDELTALVGDLIELARGDEPITDHEDVDLAAVLREAIERARRHAPQTTFAAKVEPWPMTGSRERLARAINNVLDNATKFSPPGACVEVELRDGELSVRDHGAGVPADELPHIFDRFYRARNAAQHHGSGLGLAIVKQVVESHGGSVRADGVPGGGLMLRLRFGGAAPRGGDVDDTTVDDGYATATGR
jgi:two-component system sensor histidine kinase MprB